MGFFREDHRLGARRLAQRAAAPKRVSARRPGAARRATGDGRWPTFGGPPYERSERQRRALRAERVIFARVRLAAQPYHLPEPLDRVQQDDRFLGKQTGGRRLSLLEIAPNARRRFSGRLLR